MRELLLTALFTAVSIPLWIADLRTFRVPNGGLLIAAGAIAPAAGLARGVLEAGGGALYVAAVLLLARCITRGALGGGDVKYGAVLGLAVGLDRGPAVVLVAACLAALALWATALRSGRPPRGGDSERAEPARRRVPFAPALGLSALGSLTEELLGGIP